MILAIILFLLGLVGLLAGAKWLVRGASALAATCGLSPLVIGLTVVAFGTSAPEIGVSIVGALRGEGSLIVGNVVGSNIFNILLVLGLCATITPLVVKKRLIWWDVPLMIGASGLFWLMASTGHIGRLAGLILFASIIAYLLLAFFVLKKEPHEKEAVTLPLWQQITYIVIGLIALGLGSEFLIRGGSFIARALGVSELLIGLTVMAVGTSLPELITTLIALKEGKRDLAVGNVIGSNLFNLLAVMGIAGLISPFEVPLQAVTFDIPIMLGVAIATLPIFLTGHLISRWEGLLFLFYYVIYIIYLIFGIHPYFTSALIYFILPLTVLTLGTSVVRHFRR